MARLTFQTDSRVDLPVEVYDHELGLAGRTLSSRALELEPGLYFVVARLPGRPDLHATVELADDADESIPLEPSGPGPKRRGRRAAFGDAVSERRSGGGARVRESFDMAVGGQAPRAPRSPVKPLGELRRYRRAGAGWDELPERREVRRAGRVAGHGADVVGLWPARGAPMFAVTPDRGARFYVVEVKPGRDRAGRLAPRLANESADALLDFLVNGQIGEALLLSTSTALTAEHLLSEKESDPVAGAAGALALLQLGELQRLHDWTANLAERFRWLPDALVARAEHLALVGEHEDALELLLELRRCGLPSLGAGLAYATERLRLYARIDPGKAMVRETLDWIAAYAAAVDVRAKVTTFTGDGPDAPKVASETSGA